MLLLLFVMLYAMSVLWSQEPLETLLITYQLVVLTYLLFIIPLCKHRELKCVQSEDLMALFIKGLCAVVIALYIQYIAYTLLGIPMGMVYRYNTGRVIYNLYFNAKSVLSLYLSVGMLYFFISYINGKKLSDIVWTGLFLGTFFINNSRTGLASFGICAVLYCITHYKKILGSVRVTAILVLAGVAALYLVQFIMALRINLAGIGDDNGRIELLVEALKLLPNYIVSGIGGTAEDYYSIGMRVVPHNFFVAYLMQFGVLGGMAVNLLLIEPLSEFKKKNWYYLCCILIGGLLFANWHNGLFIIPVYIIMLTEGKPLTTDKPLNVGNIV